MTQTWDLMWWSSAVFTDLPNGTVDLDWQQTAQRPTMEFAILQRQNIDTNADYDDVRDASAWALVRVLATRASQTNYLSDWVADTRTGSLGNINTSIYASWDHIHPITKISAFGTAPTIAFSGFTAPTWSATLTYLRSTEETITYFRQWSMTIPNTNGWRLFTISNVAWYTMDSVVKTLYRQSNYVGYPWNNTMEAWQVCNNYAWGATTYMYNQWIAPWNIVNISVMRVEVTYTLN